MGTRLARFHFQTPNSISHAAINNPQSQASRSLYYTLTVSHHSEYISRSGFTASSHSIFWLASLTFDESFGGVEEERGFDGVPAARRAAVHLAPIVQEGASRRPLQVPPSTLHPDVTRKGISGLEPDQDSDDGPNYSYRPNTTGRHSKQRSILALTCLNCPLIDARYRPTTAAVILPLMQTHTKHQTGPLPQPNLDDVHSYPPLAHYDFSDKPDLLPLRQQAPSHLAWPRRTDNINGYHHLNPAPQSFPIRSSQPSAPALHRLTTSFVQSQGSQDAAEHLLRRKTPRGTVDNGYDGSHAHLAPEGPAYKHVIVGASDELFLSAARGQDSTMQTGLVGQRPVPMGQGWPYSASAVTNGRALLGNSINSAPAFFAGWGFGQSQHQINMGQQQQGRSSLDPTSHHRPSQAFMAQPNRYPSSSLQCILGPAYQQVASPTIFSPAAFQQPDGWREGVMGDYRSQLPIAPGYSHHNTAVDGAFMPAPQPMHPALANGPLQGQSQPFQMHMINHPPDDGYSRYGLAQNMVQSTPRGFDFQSIEPGVGAGGPGMDKPAMGQPVSQPHFKERALAQAHKSYADLITYINHTRRLNNKRGGSGPDSRSSNKMVVYPRPGKNPVSALSPSLTKPKLVHSNTAPAGTFTQHLHHRRIQGHVATNAFAFAGPQADQAGPHNSVMAQVIPHPGSHRGPYATGLVRSLSNDFGSPPLSAKTSLDMLTGLCENSDWKWIDGMLLGGCLHYGLEHYEEALQWFQRIISLDQGHVEAISNIAATMYCLNRHEEAERHWWQAVRLRPSYLEAAEHLVGLLCSGQCSQEAVQAIEFVQERLRVRKTSPLQTATEADDSASETDASSFREFSPDPVALDADMDSPEVTFSGMDKAGQAPPGFGSSGYMIPGTENGRMLCLVHAKGNMLYALKDIEGASRAFEEAVLISTGREIRGVRSLIHRIQKELTPRGTQGIAPPSRNSRAVPGPSPLLLSPDKAKHTVQLVFRANGGQLPGLRFMNDGSHKKAVISTTSNALLSLAKIFQDAMSNGGPSLGLMRHPAGVGDILALYYLSLSIQESPSTANNVGILLAGVQQQASAHQVTPEDMALCRNIPGIVPGSGLALALAYYHYGLTLDPKHVHLHTNLGSLLKDIGQLDTAIQMYERAVQCDGTFDIALTNLANAVKDRGRIHDAINYYKRAVQSSPDFAEAVCGLSTALSSVCDWRNRGGVVLGDGRYDRYHVDGAGMLYDSKNLQPGQRKAGGLMERVVDIVGKQLREASYWGVGILQEPSRQRLIMQLQDAGAGSTDARVSLEAELRRWAGKPWEGSRVLRLIERASRAAMRSWYVDKYVKRVGRATGYPRPKPPSGLTVPAAPTVLPFHTFTCPLSAKDIRMISQRNGLRISCSTLKSPWIPATVYEPPPPPAPHLNIGYISSDFNNHPLAHLMQSVFGFHDMKRAKAFCYATTVSDDSVHRQQIEREAPVFRDVSKWGSDRIVEQIIADKIHILVNLNGYTRGARNEVFAARPAPIQMSFMGFAGTMGAEWCDYLLADSMAIPASTLRPHRDNLDLKDVFRDEEDAEAEDWVYSENIIFCRDTFFCCDHKQSADGSDERGMTWEEEQRRRWKMRKELFPKLSDDTIILGNFNQLYKV